MTAGDCLVRADVGAVAGVAAAGEPILAAGGMVASVSLATVFARDVGTSDTKMI